MKNSVALINFYFAEKKPEFIEVYLSSISFCKSIDLFLFTNFTIDGQYENVKVIKTDFKTFSGEIVKKINAELRNIGIRDRVEISSPYKIADFRPAFGLCFQELIQGYNFWGGCDLDIVIGDIEKYVTDAVMEKYDKLYEHAHFFLIRNSYECNRRFLENYEQSFAAAVHMKTNSFFEELYYKPWIPGGGINAIFDRHDKLFKNRSALCDISYKYNNLIDPKNPSLSNRNVFLFDKGKLFRLSLKEGQILKQEYFYAHFQKRELDIRTDVLDRFYVVNDAVVPYEEISPAVFRYTDKLTYITWKWIKLRYIGAISRKIHGTFRRRI